jgi:hypothetical protein
MWAKLRMDYGKIKCNPVSLKPEARVSTSLIRGCQSFSVIATRAKKSVDHSTDWLVAALLAITPQLRDPAHPNHRRGEPFYPSFDRA